MKSISLRIRKQYFDAIVTGEKTVEYRVDSPYWRKRLGYPFAYGRLEYSKHLRPRVAVFICGKRVHRRRITHIRRIPQPDGFSPQGQADVSTPMCYAIYLGDEILEKPIL